MAVILGGLLAVQAAANLQLSKATASPLGASALQLSIGTVALAILGLFVGGFGGINALFSAPWWHLIGGFGSAIYITAGIILFPRLGALHAVGLFIAGQMLTSLLIDTFGWLGVAQEPFSPSALLGGLFVLGGAGLVVKSAKLPAQEAHNKNHLLLTLFAVLAGAALAAQGPINALLRHDVERGGGTIIVAALFSFALATVVMAASLALWQFITKSSKPKLPTSKMPFWGYIGGFVGATYVVAMPLLIPILGVASTVGLTVVGQQLASMAVDRWGLMRMVKRALTPMRVAGVVLLLTGVFLIQFI